MDKPSDPAEARRHREAVELADEARHVVRALEDFQDPSQEWRRLCSELSGAHLNPAVSVAFSLRRDFPWRRVPGYVVVQLAGAVLAAWFLQAVAGVSSAYGATYPAAGWPAGDAFLAGLWASPISGASMNPARSFGPAAVAADLRSYWMYVAGPLAGAVAAVGIAFVLRGGGGVFTRARRPDRS